ncbi:unnamed protein product [Schistosoma turkestanicum]|nr:unnamed protein product [Schistosoma turkestanicum]
MRTSSGRIVRPPPSRGSQDLCLSSFSEDYHSKYNNNSIERKHSQQRKTKSTIYRSKNNIHSVNKFYSKHRKRTHRSKTMIRKLSNSTEDLSQHTTSSSSSLRRSARKRKLISSFSHFYGSSEGNDESD